MAGNANYDRLLSTTLENYQDTMEDNVFTSKPFLYALTNYGNVETLDGGVKIVQPLMYAELGNQGSYSGGDTFLTNEDEGTTAAEFDWKQYYATIRMTNIEIAKNGGSSAVLNIVSQEIMRAEMSVSESLNEIFLGDGSGNGGKDFNGIGNLIGQNATAVGGIDPSAAGNEWWKSDITTGSTAISFDAMRPTYLTTSEGADFVTNIFTTQLLYGEYDSLFVDRQRFMDPDMADQGFEALLFHNTPVSFDRNIATGDMYFINFKYITLYKLGSTWFKMSDWVEPTNQDIRIKKILLYGQLAISNRKRQGKIEDLTAAA
jgi:hypothetical protein